MCSDVAINMFNLLVFFLPVRNFEFRVARQIAESLNSDERPVGSAETNQRVTLGALKGHGKKALVGSQRSMASTQQGKNT